MKKISLLLLVLVLTLAFSGCTQPEQQVGETVKVTDLAGREVEVPKNVEKIVAIGPGALRLITYMQAEDMLVGVENVEKTPTAARPYSLVIQEEIADLPVIAQGGPDDPKVDVEVLLSVKPDVIFASSAVSTQIVEDIQQKTGIPVVVISLGTPGRFDEEELFESFRIIGKVLDKEERAEEIIDYINATIEDLSSRVADYPEDKKPKVYVGALSFKGGHGIESTQKIFPPFEVLEAKNIVKEANVTGNFIQVDKEFLLSAQPDIIFLDANNVQLVKQDYEKNPGFYRSLKAFQNGEVYSIYPFNWYWTNIELALIDTYWIGKVIYPERFADVSIAEKANEISEFFLGEPLYDELVGEIGELGKINVSSW
ncbi:iron ABC transporter substrate-binding protein [Methermicoccus shengliensis]|uniref:Iron ABC transporter substrate-binding protein n=1 Tax=Methermicoccus shengliensis TaxID=660064 RepID=A0A832VMK7_9EURY|nr:iron ABC transporter substrate-binding protein [Methermicoccus shengliensis]KUK05126.1 MAG: Iron (III) ABC transporter, ATP-binding protein (HemV-2) [Euryarchaeota archaeon 55_53]KUK30692.1 MAG: Iron (III) ABC transporter, ATP-binding protein (HemV-2) [Methanosarcinales archeaon 56_1174]MDI3487286.1 iron complex transport system substrate-binding protein [Methanosarcinales archaeon]MDN5294639.1 iron complex transport system substrate-binding protein [Methanosarcinales archaeon]HIH69346.1 ir